MTAFASGPPASPSPIAFNIAADAKQLTKLEAGVLMAVAMFQPVTRGEISEMFGREISRDLIAALREEGLIAAGPRSPKLGAPYAYVTTEKFLLEFGFESLRNLPDIEALKDAGLLSDGAPSVGASPASTTEDFPLPDAPTSAVKLRFATEAMRASIACSRPKKREASSRAEVGKSGVRVRCAA